MNKNSILSNRKRKILRTSPTSFEGKVVDDECQYLYTDDFDLANNGTQQITLPRRGTNGNFTVLLANIYIFRDDLKWMGRNQCQFVCFLHAVL